MKESYTLTINKTANVKDFSLLLLDYLSRDDEDVKTFGTLVKDMDRHTVMEIDSDEDTILFDRRLLRDVLQDIMNDVASLARANHMDPDEDKSENEDDEDDDKEGGIDDDEWEMDDEDDDEEDEEDTSVPEKGRIFRVGDYVMAQRGSTFGSYNAGERGRIMGVDPTDNIYPLYVSFERSKHKVWVNAEHFTILSE